MVQTCKWLTALCLETFWTETRLVLSPFFISNSLFLILNNAFRIGLVFTYSTACGSAVERNEKSEYGTSPSVFGQKDTA